MLRWKKGIAPSCVLTSFCLVNFLVVKNVIGIAFLCCTCQGGLDKSVHSGKRVSTILQQNYDVANVEWCVLRWKKGIVPSCVLTSFCLVNFLPVRM